MIARFFIAIGAPLVAFVRDLGEVVLLAADTFRSAFTHRLRWRLFLEQMVEIGLLSQLVVIVTGGFTGAVFAAQTYFQFNKIGMGSATGAVVSVAICRELAPVLSALMVSGRVGAAMSAEIGTMKVTEQIDALRALAVYPIDYLVVPARFGNDDLNAVARGRMHRLWDYRQLCCGYRPPGHQRDLLCCQHGAMDAIARFDHGRV